MKKYFLITLFITFCSVNAGELTKKMIVEEAKKNSANLLVGTFTISGVKDMIIKEEHDESQFFGCRVFLIKQDGQTFFSFKEPKKTRNCTVFSTIARKYPSDDLSSVVTVTKGYVGEKEVTITNIDNTAAR